MLCLVGVEAVQPKAGVAKHDVLFECYTNYQKAAGSGKLFPGPAAFQG
jgi:hypothetical protein